MSKESHSNHAHAVPLKTLLGVWVVLCVLTWVTVESATKIDLGTGNILLAMGIAVVKGSFVALFFMHLRWDKPINSYIFVSALLFVALFITLALMDTKEYQPDMIRGYAPALNEVGSAGAAGGADAQAASTGGLTGIARGEQLFTATCVACHAANASGMRELNSPALHQQEDWYIVAQLEKFRAGLRGSHPEDITGAQMRPMALTLPDEQALHDVAEYIGTLSAPMPPLTFEVDEQGLAAGKMHYDTVCVACHGTDAMGKPELRSPALVGQSDWYLVAQLTKFRKRIRGGNPKDVTGTQMQAMSITLTSDEMVQNVAAHLARMGR